MNKIKITYIVFPILIAFLMLLYSFSSKRNDQKKIKDVLIEFEVGENQFLTHDTVDKLLTQNNITVKNQNKSSIDLYTIENQVVKNPYVENANVYITPSGVLKTKIKQRDPILRIVEKQHNCYVDKYGSLVPLSANFSSHVPLVTGISSIKDINKVRELILYVNTDAFLKVEVTAVQKRGDDFIVFVRNGAYKINIGDVNDLSSKFGKFKVFYDRVLTLNNKKNIYQEINVKFHNQVVCTKQYPNGK